MAGIGEAEHGDVTARVIRAAGCYTGTFEGEELRGVQCGPVADWFVEGDPAILLSQAGSASPDVTVVVVADGVTGLRTVDTDGVERSPVLDHVENDESEFFSVSYPIDRVLIESATATADCRVERNSTFLNCTGTTLTLEAHD